MVQALEELSNEENTTAPTTTVTIDNTKLPAKKSSSTLLAPKTRRSSSASLREKKNLKNAANKVGEQNRLRNTIQNLTANIQDKRLLFDNLLKVGLISLNEQTIEMMLATFVNLMLLQPLLLPLHRFLLLKMKVAEEKEDTGRGGAEQKKGRSSQ